MRTLYTPLLCAVLAFTCLFSCQPADIQNTENDQKEMLTALRLHLDAVMQRDLASLKATITKDSAFYLILPNGQITEKTSYFIQYHEDWFKEEGWTMEMEILQYSVGSDFGKALVEAMYREKDREGKPYFHKMIITYGLEKQNGAWLVIHDHCSSLEKSE